MNATRRLFSLAILIALASAWPGAVPCRQRWLDILGMFPRMRAR